MEPVSLVRARADPALGGLAGTAAASRCRREGGRGGQREGRALLPAASVA